MQTEVSTKPYLIRALHEWCTDNGYTPYIVVAVDEHCVVPHEHVRDNEIILNIGMLATNQLELGNDFIQFQARFNGAVKQISVPVPRVMAIYARETGQGMTFDLEEFFDEELDSEVSFEPDPQDPPPKRPTLTRIK